MAKQAPPLPFSYLGKVMEGSSIVVFLGEGDRTHLVHAGDVVANYRIQEITARDMTLVYLPLDETQKINLEAQIDKYSMDSRSVHRAGQHIDSGLRLRSHAHR